MKPNFVSEEEFAAMAKRVRGGVTAQYAQTARAAARSNTRSAERIAGAIPAPAPYRSKWEAAYASKLELEKSAGLIKAWYYEPFSLKLAKGKRYRPDFLVQYPSGMEMQLEFVEVKGRGHKNWRDGMTHLKWAVQLYPMFTWRLVHWNGHGFDGEYLVNE